MPRLLMIAPAPVIRTQTGFILDAKFIEGMQQHAAFWPGEIACLLREGATHIPFGAREVTGIDGVDLFVLSRSAPIQAQALEGYDLIACSADDVHNLDIPALARAVGAKVVFTIEYILETRLQVAWHDKARSLPRRLYSMLWLLRQEYRLRRAMRRADGVQTNGYPAAALYGPMTSSLLFYLDNRMTSELFATKGEIAARAARLISNAPLRLVFSGRLERMKGAHDLVPIAKILRDRGAEVTLDIFGDGSLRGEIQAGIEAAGLRDTVRLHDAVDFETELVPWLRTNADIYLCCHRQSDPSCTYLENMGCGLAVAGFGNRMWLALQGASGAGWVVPMGDRAGLAELLAGLEREDIIACCEKAVAFSREHDFLTEFRKRMDHLADVAGVKHVEAVPYASSP